MENRKLKIIYEDKDLVVLDKPAGIVVFPEGNQKEETLIDILLKEKVELKGAGEPPRYGIIHRLDKNTSGILLVAKNTKTLDFFQKEFKDQKVDKKYLALIIGELKEDGQIETLLGRSKKDRLKQQVYLPGEPSSKGKRKSLTLYKVLERYEGFTLLEVTPKTGRKHQIRSHLAYINHPIVGDKVYGFKNQFCPNNFNRHFLHASYLKTRIPDNSVKEFQSEMPTELKEVLISLTIQ